MKTILILLVVLVSHILAQTSQENYLLLEITFDQYPQQISWKFNNARSTATLDYRTFGYYTSDLAGSTVKERLVVLHEDDLSGDPLVEDVIREYSFVIYDEGGDGLCCTAGEGSYSIYNKGKLLLTGNAFGLQEEHQISLDPSEFLENESTDSDNAVGSSNDTESTAQSNNSGSETNVQGTSNTPTAVTDASTPVQPTLSPSPSASPISPTTQIAVDQEKWYCGSSWDWIIRNCDQAIQYPCRGGDASVCPPNFACFASTPCTPEPTDAPSDSPSMMPSVEPTASPTRSPLSESAFVDFLYGASTAEDETGEINSDGENLATDEIDNALTNSDSLQFHFYCGYSWSHADETCNKFCPTGDRAECPENMDCFANTMCDGRETPPPTESLAPTSSAPIGSVNINIGSGGSGGVSSGVSNSQLCTLCPNNQIDTEKSLSINGKDVTCGSVENMFTFEKILMGSDNCNSIQKMYQETCCFDGCQLCELSTGGFLDLQDVLLEKGAYSATCSEVNNILSANSKDDKMCLDAKEQLAGECCYKQCTLCNTDKSTSWYATVNFEGIQSTCLGLDFMLRNEQVSYGSDRCSNTRGMYESQCCYVAPENPCQLCEADGKVYGVNSAKSVTTLERQSAMSCAWLNDNLSKLPGDDEQCEQDKAAYFGQCCDLSGIIGVPNGEVGAGNNNETGRVNGTETASTGSNITGSDVQAPLSPEPVSGPNENSTYWSSGSAEWDPTEWNPSDSASSSRGRLITGMCLLASCFIL